MSLSIVAEIFSWFKSSTQSYVVVIIITKTRQAPAGLREGNYESDQELTICNSLLGWTWAGKSELGKRSESNLERRKGGVVEKQ